MAQTIELAQVRLLSFPLFSLLSSHRNTDRQARSPKSTRKAVSKSLAIGTSLRGQRASSSRAGWPLLRGSQGEISKMVRKFSIPIHEWKLALGSCVYHLENRVCSGVSADVGQACVISAWIPCYGDAHQGALQYCFMYLFPALRMVRRHRTKLYVKWSCSDLISRILSKCKRR